MIAYPELLHVCVYSQILKNWKHTCIPPLQKRLLIYSAIHVRPSGSKQVIRHKQADSVCFDGTRWKPDSISRVSGLYAAPRSSDAGARWGVTQQVGKRALPLCTRHCHACTSAGSERHGTLIHKCRSLKDNILLAAVPRRPVERGRGEGQREESVGVTLKSGLCTTWINWIWQVDG